MSSTRKPKPPDKGAPTEHKPSQKVALQEVMRSLQDLVSNELSTDATPPEAPKRRRADKNVAEPSPSISPDDRGDSAASEEVESITLEGLPEAPAEIPAEPETPPPAIENSGPKTKNAKSKTDPSGIQQELPYLDALPELPAEDPAPPVVVDTEQPGALLPEAEGPSAPSILDFPAPAIPDDAAPAIPTAEHAIIPENWDDIPVLEEAVDMADINDSDEGHAGGALLPQPGDARRLAIQVAARLNVELRKSGQPGLSSELITRLARMLEEALAKGTANVENTKKH